MVNTRNSKRHDSVDSKYFDNFTSVASCIIYLGVGKSANITPDTTTGIGGWTEEMFLAKFKNYKDKEAYDYDPGKYNSEMPWTIFANMTDDDIKSIYKYLRTIKPIKNTVTKWPQ